jgi:hypothetical protein
LTLSLSTDTRIGRVQKDGIASTAVIVITTRRSNASGDAAGSNQTIHDWCRTFRQGLARAKIAVLVLGAVASHIALGNTFGIVKGLQKPLICSRNIDPIRDKVAQRNAKDVGNLSGILAKLILDTIAHGRASSREGIGRVHIQINATGRRVGARGNNDTVSLLEVASLEDLLHAHLVDSSIASVSKTTRHATPPGRFRELQSGFKVNGDAAAREGYDRQGKEEDEEEPNRFHGSCVDAAATKSTERTVREYV